MIGCSSLIAELTRQRRNLKRRWKLSNTDVVVVSHAKSGRTWLAAMISHVYHQEYKIDESKIIRFDNFHRINREIPRIFFTHDNRKRPDRQPLASVDRFVGKRVILLVRDPRDVAVSVFFHSLRHHVKGPAGPHGAADLETTALYESITGTELPLVIDFLKRWQKQIEAVEQSLVVRFEDMRARPCDELARVMEFIGGELRPAVIERAVDFASFEKLRAKEAAHFFESDRLHPGRPSDPNSFKVRRGKVGGYRDYFTPTQLSHIEAMIADQGLEKLGYSAADPLSDPAVPV